MNQVSFTNTDEIGTPNKPLDSFKEGGEIKHISGEAGGYLVGKRHSEGGIKAINKSTGQPLEMEGGEVVITRNAVSDTQKYEFEGEMLTNREILSKINEGGGGVAFADGGEVCHVCDAEYNYKGKKMKDSEIFREMALGGEVDDILDAVDDLTFEDLDLKFDDETDATLEAINTIVNQNSGKDYCFKGKKNTPYDGRYFFTKVIDADIDEAYFEEVFVETPDYFTIKSKDIVDNFTVLPKGFEIYVNWFEHIAYKQIGNFDSFTYGSPTGLRATFENPKGLFNVDTNECIVITEENRELLTTNNPEVSPETTNQEILNYVEYWKTLLPSTFNAFDKFDNRFKDAKFFRAYAVIHRQSISSPIQLKYFMVYGKMTVKGSALVKIYTFNLRDDEKRVWMVDTNTPFDDFLKRSDNFSNLYNLDIVIGYKDCYNNINLSYILNSEIPIKIKNSDFSNSQSFLSYLSTGDNEFAYKFVNKGSENTIVIDGLEDPKMDDLIIDFNQVNTEQERKYIESRIRELGLKIKLFRASMSLEEFGAVQRELRKYVSYLQDSYLREKNSNPLSFFERIKDAIKVDFGNIDAKYPLTKNLSINGLSSQLTEQEWLTVRSEDFKIWFGDWETAYYDQNYSGVSVIIDDATKEPMPVYHGTNVKFVDWKTYESNNLHYFAKKREMSEWFAKAWKMGRDDKAGKESAQIKQGNPFQGEYLYRVFLNIKNPIDFSPFGVEKVKLADLVAYLKIKYGVGDYDLWSNNDYFKKGTVTMESKVFTWQIIRLWQNFNTYIREFTPYDGFIFYEYIPSKANSGNIEDASLSFCAFRTEQIKFHDAVSFSPEVSDSRFALGGKVITKKKRRKTK